ncbi:MAG: hypothetical protein M3494_02545 [Actinomycetota bacterium]|jgi:hypothetical protein|nr:hypothetical protein [Actinomycetota bacterium]
MTKTKTNDIPTYKPGDTIRITLEVADENGVADVGARFRLNKAGTARSFYKSVKLDGDDVEAVAALEIEVDAAFPSGDYSCEYLALTDGLGNQTLIVSPGIEFHVEGTKENNEGPALRKWSFA